VVEDESLQDSSFSSLQAMKTEGAKNHYGFLQGTLRQIQGEVDKYDMLKSKTGKYISIESLLL